MKKWMWLRWGPGRPSAAAVIDPASGTVGHDGPDELEYQRVMRGSSPETDGESDPDPVERWKRLPVRLPSGETPMPFAPMVSARVRGTSNK